ncbi:MAG: hypothetical protein GY750_01140 [Lentisphaerae bacterium]|nr:hypothetical protein [Lentisphaerota bacterium]MCP4100023.1 hypothetical protein [Lentisphaerota bacterium]
MKLKWIEHKDLAMERNPIISREEFLDYMTFKGNKRTLYNEIFGPLIGLKEEWEEQGATQAELDFSAFEYRAPKVHPIQVNTGFMLPERKIIEDSDERLVYIDGLGRTMRLDKGYSTIALPENYPVKNMDDWLKIKQFCVFNERRFAKGWLKNAISAYEAGFAMSVSIPGGFDAPRQLFGEEELCYALYEQPELIHDILNTFAETALKVFDIVTAELNVDILFVHEDMAGKSGPLMGPDMIREFIKPYYLKCWNFLKERGARLFEQDSDGDMNSILDVFIESGINCMFPMEPGSGMDIVEVRKKYGDKLAFYGGIDKYKLRTTKAEIEAELEYKIPAVAATGGCVFALDHRIPNGVPLDNYKFYLDKLHKIIIREESRRK